jgi:integral membrane sensor domain MASE1
MHSRRFSTLPIIGVVTVVYFIAGKLGLKLAFVNASASAVWPPSGIALAALLLLGYRTWPAIFLGAFLVNLTTAGKSPPHSVLQRETRSKRFAAHGSSMDFLVAVALLSARKTFSNSGSRSWRAR